MPCRYSTPGCNGTSSASGMCEACAKTRDDDLSIVTTKQNISMQAFLNFAAIIKGADPYFNFRTSNIAILVIFMKNGPPIMLYSISDSATTLATEMENLKSKYTGLIMNLVPPAEGGRFATQGNPQSLNHTEPKLLNHFEDEYLSMSTFGTAPGSPMSRSRSNSVDPNSTSPASPPSLVRSPSPVPAAGPSRPAPAVRLPHPPLDASLSSLPSLSRSPSGASAASLSSLPSARRLSTASGSSDMSDESAGIEDEIIIIYLLSDHNCCSSCKSDSVIPFRNYCQSNGIKFVVGESGQAKGVIAIDKPPSIRQNIELSTT